MIGSRGIGPNIKQSRISPGINAGHSTFWLNYRFFSKPFLWWGWFSNFLIYILFCLSTVSHTAREYFAHTMTVGVRLQNLGLHIYLAPVVFEQAGTFIVQYLLWHWAFVFVVLSKVGTIYNNQRVVRTSWKLTFYSFANCAFLMK